MVGSAIQQPARILFVCHPHIGDAVNLTAAAWWIRNRWPECHLTVLTSDSAMPIFMASGACDCVAQRPNTWSDRLWFVLAARREPYDLAVFSYPQRTLLRMVRLAGVRTVAGVQSPKGEVWDVSVPERHGSSKVPGEVADVLTLLGCDCHDWTPVVHRSEADVLAVDSAISEFDRPLVGVHVGASDPRKRWPLASFVQIAEQASFSGHIGLFIGGPSEALALRPHFSADRILAGRLSLTQTIELLSRCRCLVTNDSGPAHLAAAAGCPAVVLYGPTHSEDHSPFGTGNRLIQAECHRSCRQYDECDASCLAGLAVDTVWQEVSRLLDNKVAAP